MLNRDRIGFWTRIGALLLAAIFILSGVLFGIGSNVSYNPFDLVSGASDDAKEEPTTGQEEQIAQAEQDLEEEPENIRAIKRLGALYLQNGQTQDAARVLEQGREVDPDDPVIPLYLGQVYDREAQGVADEEERQERYRQAGDAYAAAAEIQEDRPQAYLLAGQAYQQAGDKSQAIRYWNGYLDLEPEGDQADEVRERIKSLLSGDETTGLEGGAKGPEPKGSEK